MPLVRVEVRNEYGLGMPELYTEADIEDPKAVLDGVAVAGLVGILRQLGDLAEFAAEVFHGLQEQLLITSSRSHKLVERVHNIEAALPPLEKAILAQRSHLHFAYTAGSHWHTRLATEQNHFIYSDLPRCIMDSYEDCWDPPRLHKLDKFDIGGSGSCFRRYSDPTYFRRTSGPYESHLQSAPRLKKARRNKRKKFSLKYRDAAHDAPIIMHAERTDFGSSNFEEKTSPSQDPPTFHIPQKSENGDHLTSFDSRNGPGYLECIIRPSYSTQSEDNNAKEPSSDSNLQHNSIKSYLDSATLDENSVVQEETTHDNYLVEHSRSQSSYITWDEKLEIIDSAGRPNDAAEISCKAEKIGLNSGFVDHIGFHDERLPTSVIFRGQPGEIESETDFYMDALNTIESESETDVDCHKKRELKHSSSSKAQSISLESHMEAHSSSNNENYDGTTKSDQETSPHVDAISSISFTTPDKVKSEELERHGTNSDTVREPSSQSLPSEQMLRSGAHTTLSNPVMFWTNGGLLGLEPSKPPDFGLPPAIGPGPVEETRTDATKDSFQKNIMNDDGHVVRSESSGINSSRIFEFSNRLLVNGSRKQVSLIGNEQLASSVKSDVPENTRMHKTYQNVTGIPFKEQFGSGIPLITPSSPPLEHMKMSFQPIDGFETSKLKLGFPDGDNNNESSGNMFPSFQLVPEPEISLYDSASDSDDDTFCRSSASEDCRSNPMESNSEQWDSSDSPRIKDHELDDAFGRIPSAESASSTLANGIRFQQGFTDPGNHRHQSSFTNNGILFDIPSFDFMNDNQVTYDVNEEPTPAPPPLPPMEWRGTKPHPGVTMEKEDPLSETLAHALNLTPRDPTVPLQHRPAPSKQDHFVETVDLTLKHKPDWQSLHVQSELNRTTNGKTGDEKEDFLQQIRTKSLNLRRTSTVPPTITPAGPTDVKVTAILEKANAIRKVVGNDDGEDDNWSDT